MLKRKARKEKLTRRAVNRTTRMLWVDEVDKWTSWTLQLESQEYSSERKALQAAAMIVRVTRVVLSE